MATPGDAMRAAVGLVTALDERCGPGSTWTEADYETAVGALLDDVEIHGDELYGALAALAMLALNVAAAERIAAGRETLLTPRELLADLGAHVADLEDE